MPALCIVCAEEVDVAAISPCNHFICAKCALRMRVKMQRKACCVCNAEAERILLTKNVPAFPKTEMVTDHPELQWDILLPKCRLRDYQWSLDIDDSVDKSLLDMVRRLRDPLCPVPQCDKAFGSVRDLENHLWHTHRLEYCGLCLQFRSVFLSEQTLYGRNELSQHMSMDKTCRKDLPQFKGHPLCEFCDQNFYDNDHLFDHLHKSHETCHVCQKNGFNYSYYQDVPMLEKHFRQCHSFCDHPECSGMSPMERVFASDFDLKAHQAQCHAKGRKKLDVLELGFNFGEYGAQQDGKGGGGGGGGKGKGRGKGRGGRGGGGGGGGGYDGGAAAGEARAGEDGAGTAVHITFCHSNGTSRSPNLSTFADSDPRAARRRASPAGVSSSSTTTTSPRASPDDGRPAASPPPGSGSPLSPPSPLPDPEATTRQRNRQLMQRMKDMLGEERFGQFRIISSNFLKGEMLCAEYYKHFVDFFGSKGQAIFPEMVDLLPDPTKKDALLLAHNHYHSKEFGKPTAGQKKEQEKKAQRAAEESSRQQQEEQWPTLAGGAAPAPAPAASTATAAGGTRKSGKGQQPSEDFPALPPARPAGKEKKKAPGKKGSPAAAPNVWGQPSPPPARPPPKK